ncbi:uncharacterized protein LOC129768139 isoform X2 [Toxorhynchites rutilus septentrionalis]|nr:uncharacterized protein LOC129768139 isoform X2 [Toxorhynchites rutilus septentrionalis]
MQSLASQVTRQYDEILHQLKQSPSPPRSPKRRKAHSFESPSTSFRMNDSSMIQNKSDPEVSSSALNLNINPPDSEESFFVLTQSPTRDPLSPKATSSGKTIIQCTPPKKSWFKAALFQEQEQQKTPDVEKKRKKNNLSLSRYPGTSHMSPESHKQFEQLPIRQKMTTPKPTASRVGDQQENLAPVGKWTSKKTNNAGGLGRTDSTLRWTPTNVKHESTLLNKTRLRQTKLRFPDDTSKRATDDDETFCSDFVVPSPTSFSGSRFLKSVKKKEQSSLVADNTHSERVETELTKPDEDDFDIDQTYFSEAEKVMNPSRPKTEPLSQSKSKTFVKESVLEKETQQPDLDTSSVLLVKRPSQEEIISIEETQPDNNDLFMAAIKEEHRKEQQARQSVLNIMGPPRAPMKLEFPFKRDKSPARKPTERRCTECTKHYQFLLNRGMAPDAIQYKLPRNCRECRIAQLHETPPGFWNPGFSPTQRD